MESTWPPSPGCGSPTLGWRDDRQDRTERYRTSIPYRFNTELGTLDVTGREVHATKKFRDVARTGKAAIVIDGLAPGAGFNPWAIEIAGPAEAITGPPALIRIHPDRVRSRGLDHAV